MIENVTVIDHPLARHCVARLRDRNTEPRAFRVVTRRLTALLAIEATRDLRTATRAVETPLETTQGDFVSERLVVIPILRAGLGMLHAFVELFPEVSVGYLGLERDEETARASLYYQKLPAIEGSRVLVIDPMLATGGSACLALGDILKRAPASVRLICIVAAPEGVRAVSESCPQVEIYTAALDRELNARKYILPGLGDFGDRLYGTL